MYETLLWKRFKERHVMILKLQGKLYLHVILKFCVTVQVWKKLNNKSDAILNKTQKVVIMSGTKIDVFFSNRYFSQSVMCICMCTYYLSAQKTLGMLSHNCECTMCIDACKHVASVWSHMRDASSTIDHLTILIMLRSEEMLWFKVPQWDALLREVVGFTLRLEEASTGALHPYKDD